MLCKRAVGSLTRKRAEKSCEKYQDDNCAALFLRRMLEKLAKIDQMLGKKATFAKYSTLRGLLAT